jgi:hypothetical protein
MQLTLTLTITHHPAHGVETRYANGDVGLEHFERYMLGASVAVDGDQQQVPLANVRDVVAGWLAGWRDLVDVTELGWES